MLEELVIYQDIFKKGERSGERRGERRGEQRGAEQEARKLVMRQIERRVGKLSLKVQRQIEPLVLEQLEALFDALIDFQTKKDLTHWLKLNPPARKNGTRRTRE